jgi:hypothetical protein
MQFSKCSLRKCIGMLRTATATSMFAYLRSFPACVKCCPTLHHAAVFAATFELARKASRFGMAA